MKWEQLKLLSAGLSGSCALYPRDVFQPACGLDISPLEQGIREGDNPVCCPETAAYRCTLKESRFLRVKRKAGGRLHLKLNTCERPIANKYREGKMKRTLKRELKSA